MGLTQIDRLTGLDIIDHTTSPRIKIPEGFVLREIPSSLKGKREFYAIVGGDEFELVPSSEVEITLVDKGYITSLEELEQKYASAAPSRDSDRDL